MGTASFFLGIFLFYVLDFIVHCLDRDHDIEVMDQIVHEVVAEGEREEERANGCNVGSSPGKVDVVVHTVVHDPQKDGTPEAADLGSNPAMTMQACKPAVEVMAVSSTRTLKMGFMTAVAIAIHNFPEGLLAFIGLQTSLTMPRKTLTLASCDRDIRRPFSGWGTRNCHRNTQYSRG